MSGRSNSGSKSPIRAKTQAGIVSFDSNNMQLVPSVCNLAGSDRQRFRHSWP